MRYNSKVESMSRPIGTNLVSRMKYKDIKCLVISSITNQYKITVFLKTSVPLSTEMNLMTFAGSIFIPNVSLYLEIWVLHLLTLRSHYAQTWTSNCKHEFYLLSTLLVERSNM